MNYVIAAILVVALNLGAVLFTLISPLSYGEALAALAVGSVAMLAGDFYTSKKEER